MFEKLIAEIEHKNQIDILFTKVVEHTTGYVVDVEMKMINTSSYGVKDTKYTNLICKDHPEHQLYVDLKKARSAYYQRYWKPYKGKLTYKV